MNAKARESKKTPDGEMMGVHSRPFADKQDFFRPRPASRPTMYAYEDSNPQYAGLLKVGYTTVDVKSRVAQQYPTLRPGRPPYRIVLEESAMRNDGTVITRTDALKVFENMSTAEQYG